jgi:hypothetical protein
MQATISHVWKPNSMRGSERLYSLILAELRGKIRLSNRSATIAGDPTAGYNDSKH